MINAEKTKVERKCRECGKVFIVNEFNNWKRSCSVKCSNKYARHIHYINHRDAEIASHLKWKQSEKYPAFLEKTAKKAKIKYHENIEENREYSKNKQREHTKAMKEKFYEEYKVGSTVCCRICGETEKEFLTVAHNQIYPGCQHRKATNDTTLAVIRDLRKKGFPKDLGIGIECYNCQLIQKLESQTTKGDSDSVIFRTKILEIYHNRCECCGEHRKNSLEVYKIDCFGIQEDSARLRLLREIFKAGKKDSRIHVYCSNCSRSARYNNGVCVHKRHGDS